MVQTKEQASPMAQEKFDTDIVVIGGGPGGYVCAIRAAQLGAKVTVVEKEYLGGTCLNWGCIPSKALIASADAYQSVLHSNAMGVKIDGKVSFDFDTITSRKDKIVTTLRGGVGILFKKNGVTHVEGTAKFVDENTIEVEKDGKKQKISARNFIVATGSTIIVPKIPGLEGSQKDGIWTSDDAVMAPFVPKKLVIVGGGVIGVEFAYVFNALGSDVTVVEMMPKIIPMMDEDCSTELGKLLTRQGVKIMSGSAVEKLTKNKKAWKVSVKSGTKSESLDADVVLVAVGRRAFTDNLNLEKIGVKTSRTGIDVGEDMRTNVDNIFAIGDVNGIIQLA
ncbi:MAG TPA: FAD-dependent oxidoreductase, partial [Fimbriimonadaceae bacterium]|nr:FAD-dependent oxidoreductase [Fimbriimonadaceae bacterium]